MSSDYSLDGYQIGVTGTLSLFGDTLNTVKRDLATKNLWTLPFIFILIAYMVKLWGRYNAHTRGRTVYTTLVCLGRVHASLPPSLRFH